jgi:hypothetical protein
VFHGRVSADHHPGILRQTQLFPQQIQIRAYALLQQTALALIEKYDSLITTVLIGNNLVNIAGTAIATLLFTTRIMPQSMPRA